MRNTETIWIRAQLLILGLLILPVFGCGAVAQMMYVIKGHEDPPEFAGLEEQRVAVVCVSDASAFGPDKLTTAISNVVGLKLESNGRKIDVLPQADIQQWIDQNGWDETDFVSLAKGVTADKILAIDLDSYSIHEGRTIFKGRSELTAKVIDVATGKVEFIHGPELFEFPKNGRPAIQMTDRQFESIYLAKLTDRIAKRFYKHDRLESVADDASMMY